MRHFYKPTHQQPKFSRTHLFSVGKTWRARWVAHALCKRIIGGRVEPLEILFVRREAVGGLVESDTVLVSGQGWVGSHVGL